MSSKGRLHHVILCFVCCHGYHCSQCCEGSVCGIVECHCDGQRVGIAECRSDSAVGDGTSRRLRTRVACGWLVTRARWTFVFDVRGEFSGTTFALMSAHECVDSTVNVRPSMQVDCVALGLSSVKLSGWGSILFVRVRAPLIVILPCFFLTGSDGCWSCQTSVMV